jgi:hypothetical protein
MQKNTYKRQNTVHCERWRFYSLYARYAVTACAGGTAIAAASGCMSALYVRRDAKGNVRWLHGPSLLRCATRTQQQAHAAMRIAKANA